VLVNDWYGLWTNQTYALMTEAYSGGGSGGYNIFAYMVIVKDNITKTPVSNALIWLNSTGYHRNATTNLFGRVGFPGLFADFYTLTIQAEGYKAFTRQFGLIGELTDTMYIEPLNPEQKAAEFQQRQMLAVIGVLMLAVLLVPEKIPLLAKIFMLALIVILIAVAGKII